MCEESFETIIECMIKKLKSELVPAGTVIIRPTTFIPEGFLECNGAEVSREDYAELFEVLGTSYGTGDGVETFNLPDLRGEFVRGFDNGRGVDIDRLIGSSQGDAIRNIEGTFGNIIYQSGQAGGNGKGAFVAKTGTYGDAYTGSSSLKATNDGIDFDASRVVPTAEENRPRNIAMVYCIKY